MKKITVFVIAIVAVSLSCAAFAESLTDLYDETGMEYLSAMSFYGAALSSSAFDPDNYTALLGIALIEQSLHHTSEALTRLTRLIEQHADRAELYTIRAEIEAENRQPELAIMDLDKAIELEPGNANTVLTRAYLYKLIGNKRLAHHDFERAIELGVPRSSLKRELKETK